MPHKLTFHPAIHFEIDEALLRYESISYELGLSFESELINCYAKIAANPQYFFIIHKKLKIRRALLKRFPYKLIFQIQKNNVYGLFPLHIIKEKPIGENGSGKLYPKSILVLSPILSDRVSPRRLESLPITDASSTISNRLEKEPMIEFLTME
jgi:hypothetical protein